MYSPNLTSSIGSSQSKTADIVVLGSNLRERRCIPQSRDTTSRARCAARATVGLGFAAAPPFLYG